MTYTPEETATIGKAVMMSGMAVAIADLGIVSTAIEMAALAKEVAGATQSHPNNSIIQGAFSPEALKQGGLGEPPKDMTPENAVEKATEAIHAAIAIVTPKATPEEVTDFKQFIMTASEAVAKAAGSGLFGSGSSKVSDQEAAALDKLKAVLGV